MFWIRKNLKNMLVCMITLGLLIPVNTGQARAQTEIDLQALDAYLTESVKNNRIQGLAVGIVQGDQVIFTNGYGSTSLGEAATSDTQFFIGSVSKPFTALAVLQLVDEGLIDLDAPVQDYIPWFQVADPKASAEITIRNLLNHTSGLSENGDRNASIYAPNLEEQGRLLKDAHLTAPVGTKFQYYNQNYRLLGLVIEEVSGMSYSDYIQSHIFEPLNMTRSAADPKNAPDLAQAYTRFFGFAVPVQQPYNPGALPSGYLISTAEDLSKFLIAQIQNRKPDGTQLLDPDLLQAARATPAGVESEYGMGWLVMDEGDTIAHGGTNEFYQTFLLFHPKEEIGLVMLFNQNSLESMQFENNSVRDGLLNFLQGHEPKRSSYGWIGWVLLVLFALDLFNHIRLFAALKNWLAKAAAKKPSRVWVGLALGIILPLFVIVGIPFLVSVIKGGAPSWIEPLRFLPDLVFWLLLGMTMDLIRNIIKTVLMMKKSQV